MEKLPSYIEESLLGRAVIRTCLERGTLEEVSLEYAVQKLESYWEKDAILPMLAEGRTLWSPYAEYRMKKLEQPSCA